VGLIQHSIEANGMATISLSINRPYTEKVKPPRSIFLPWPLGHPLGESGYVNQQAAVLQKAFEALYAIDRSGEIMDVGWRWRQQTYPAPGWLSDPASCIDPLDPVS
jgi:hypothetical protein